MTTSHTPGPWRHNGSVVEGPRMALKIAECGGGYGPLSKSSECWAAKAEAEGEANARLIAAAPEMLAALIQAEASARVQAAIAGAYADAGRDVEANRGLATEHCRWADVYRAAIAKATGGDR